jgi:hypothetical protein
MEPVISGIYYRDTFLYRTDFDFIATYLIPVVSAEIAKRK